MLITLIGAGNLATQLGLALQDAGHRFQQVYSHTAGSAAMLAFQLKAEAVTDPALIQPGADLYLCALKDDVIQEVLCKLTFSKSLLVHTAGSLPMEILADFSTDYGVFYPLQTFSKGRRTDFSTIPVFVEAVRPDSLNLLTDLASGISGIVSPLSSDKRKTLHLSAVFACNFVNYLYGIADDLLHEQGLDFNYLLPLIDETAAKVHELSPASAQTGPAVRYDEQVMNRHLEWLQSHPEWATLYKTLSLGIYQRKNTDTL